MQIIDLRKKKPAGALVHALVIVGEFLAILGMFAVIYLLMIALS